jgi:hypothetical protein
MKKLSEDEENLAVKYFCQKSQLSVRKVSIKSLNFQHGASVYFFIKISLTNSYSLFINLFFLIDVIQKINFSID